MFGLHKRPLTGSKLSLPHQDDCKTINGTKQYTLKHAKTNKHRIPQWEQQSTKKQQQHNLTIAKLTWRLLNNCNVLLQTNNLIEITYYDETREASRLTERKLPIEPVWASQTKHHHQPINALRLSRHPV